MRGQREQARLLLGEDLGHRAIALLRMRPPMGDLITPAPKLGVEVVDVAEGAGREEGIAQVADLALDLALGQSRRLRLMTRLRSESSGSPIRSTR